eukprot:UN05948
MKQKIESTAMTLDTCDILHVQLGLLDTDHKQHINGLIYYTDLYQTYMAMYSFILS